MSLSKLILFGRKDDGAWKEGTNGLPDEDEMLMMNWKETLWAWGMEEPQRGREAGMRWELDQAVGLFDVTID